MMSLVSTPVTLARVTAPKKARTQTVAKASVADAAKSSAVAGALALTIMAQPALAMTEIGQIADKASDAKAIAAAEYAELLNKKAAGKATAPGPTKTKNLAVGLPSLSLPSFSAPSVGGGSKAAPKEAPKANQGSVKVEGEGFLGVAMLALFSPLAVVAVFSVQTLLRVIPQAAEGKEFFPKDTMPF